MPKLIVSSIGGEERCLDAKSGLTGMEIIRDAGGTDLMALCGGACSCCTCHVYVDSSCWNMLEPMGEDEGELLDSSSRRTQYSRLSCQIRMSEKLDGLRVTVVPQD